MDLSNSICFDNDNNAHIAGSFNGTAYFENYSIISMGLADIFIAKYDSNGNQIWVKAAGGATMDLAESIAHDQNNNVYIFGNFTSPTAYFDSLAITTSATGIFVAKCDYRGLFEWVKAPTGSGTNNGAYALAVDNSNNVYYTGSFEGSLSFSGNSIYASGIENAFLTKYNSSGGFLLTRRIGSVNLERGYAITIDSDENAYITRLFYYNSTFGTISLSGKGEEDIFVAKIDKAGSVKMALGAGGSDVDIGNAIALNSTGDLIIAGEYRSSATFSSISVLSSGNNDIFLAKINNEAGFGVNITDDLHENRINFYPNPNKGAFLIENLDGNYIEISIFNSLGKAVYTNQSQEIIVPVNLRLQDTGVFFVHIKNSKNQIITNKIIVLR